MKQNPSEQKKLEAKFLNAARNHQVATFNQCLSDGVDINCTNDQGKSALHLICYSTFFNEDSIKNLNTLLEQPKLNINAQDQEGKIVLHYFMERFSADPEWMEINHKINDRPSLLLKKLLDKGALLNSKDGLGKIPLEIGIIPNIELIETFLHHRGRSCSFTYPMAVDLIKKSYYAPTIHSFIYCFNLARRFNWQGTDSVCKTKTLAAALLQYSRTEIPNYHIDNFNKNKSDIDKKLAHYLAALKSNPLRMDEYNAYSEHIAKD